METTIKEQKKEVNQRELTKIEEWDHVAFDLIRRELVPKGFKEIKSGNYKGNVQANIPFLSKQAVGRCQKISAQMVRTFRNRAYGDLKMKLDAWYIMLNHTPWYHFKARYRIKMKSETLRDAMEALSNVSVK